MRHDTGNFMRRYEMRERAALMGGRVVIRVGQIQHRRRGMGYDATMSGSLAREPLRWESYHSFRNLRNNIRKTNSRQM